MPISSLSTFARLYQLIPTTVLKAYEQPLAELLFGLKKPETSFAAFSIAENGYWRYSEKKKNKINPFAEGQKPIANTKAKAVEIAEQWLHNSNKKLQTAVQQKGLDETLKNMIPTQSLRLESATPIYHEQSKAIAYWELRYFMELRYNRHHKARVQGQSVLLKIAQRLIGIDFNCRSVTDEIMASALVVPAPLQQQENIVAAQLPDSSEQSEETDPILPLVFVLQKGVQALPFWLAQDGKLLPAVMEGEVMESQYGTYNSYIYNESGKFINIKYNTLFGIYVVSAEIEHSIKQLGGDNYLKGVPESELKIWASFYLSDETISQGSIIAKQEDDKAKAIINDKTGEELTTRIRRMMLGEGQNQEGKITELSFVLYITEESNECQIYDMTKYIHISNRMSNSLTLKDRYVEEVITYMKKMGYIPVAHAHTHGQYYSTILESLGKRFQEMLDDETAVERAVVFAKTASPLLIGNPSEDDHHPHFFFNDKENKETYGVTEYDRIQFIFTNKGFTVYSSDVRVNTGDFFDYKEKKKTKTQSE